jgi:hypothetical protein
MTTDATTRHSDCVVIDTNTWRSQLLLKTPVGTSLVYTLGRQQGFIGLPEVVERELTAQILEHGREAAEKVKNGSNILNTLTDSPIFPLPASQINLEQIVKARLDQLAPILVRVPFTLAHDQVSDSISDGFVQEIRFLTRTSRHAREFRHNDPSIPFPRQVRWG